MRYIDVPELRKPHKERRLTLGVEIPKLQKSLVFRIFPRGSGGMTKDKNDTVR